MTASDLAVLVRGIAPVVREYVGVAVKSVGDRLLSLEQRASVAGRDGRDGKDADASVVEELKAEISNLRFDLSQMKAAAEQVDMRALIDAAVTKAFAGLPAPKDGVDGKDGQSVDPAAVESLVVVQVDKAVSALPVPEDGVSILTAKVDGEWLVVSLSDGTVIHTGKVVGKDVDMGEVNTLISSSVQKAVAALPVPKDGRSVTVEDVAPLIGAEVAKAIASLPAPKDGVGLMGALVDRSGHLVVTLSDGTAKDVGPVVGRDVDMDEVTKAITAELAKWPIPQNGKDGLNGTHGVGFDDLRFGEDEHGRTTLEFVRGDVVKSVLLPGFYDQGVYESEKAYVKGDSVTYDGSIWLAKKASQGQQPGTNVGAPFWRLSAKRGRDGKPGPQGTKGMDGKDGAPGKDGNRY